MDTNLYLRKSYFPGKVLQGNSAIQELPSLIEMFGGKAYVLVTPSMEKIAKQLGLAENQTIELFRGPCCWQEIERITANVKKGDYSVVVGFGGGKVVDTAKVVADQLHLHCIIVPSVASSSAPYSACSVIYTPEDIFESVYYERHSPDVLLIDNKIISGANPRFLVAGMGDSLSVNFETRGCLKTDSPNSLGGKQNYLSIALSQFCYDTLIKYGKQAKLSAEEKIITPSLERIIEVNVFLAGIAFEGGGLAAAHAIHNGLTIIPKVHEFLHGEIVAFGVLAELHLSDANPAEIDEVYGFCEAVGLPTTLAQLGASDLSQEQLMEVAEFALKDPYMPHEADHITAEKIFYAIKEADSMGRNRKVSGS